MMDDKRRRLLPDKKYLFVLLATKHCQLKFEALLVYSFLVYRAGTRHPAVAQRRIADNLALCRTTVRRNLRSLEELALVKKTNDGRCYALEPKDKLEWFVRVKCVNTAEWEWHKRFASFKMHVPRPKKRLPVIDRTPRPDPTVPVQEGSATDAATGTMEAQPRQRYLTPRENAVLWKIHSWNTGRVLMTVTHQGLATQLRLSRETVCRAIKNLKKKGLLDDDLQVTIKDEDRDFWLDAPAKLRRNPKTQAQKSLAETVIGWYKPNGGQLAYFKNGRALSERLDEYEAVMREAGYNGADIRHYWETAAFTFCKGDRRYFECFILKAFSMVFRAVAEIHKLKGDGYRNSLGLLKRKTEGVVRSIKTRYENRQFADYDPLLDWEPDFGQIRFGASLGRGQGDG